MPLLVVLHAAVLGATFVLLFLDRTLPEYVDESDNLLGGRLVAGGYRLYVDYFSQHMPVPYYAAALATLLGATDLTVYRAFFAVFVTLVLGFIAWYFRARLSPILVLTLVGLIGIGHPIFSGYMVLADHFFALALLVIMLLILAHDAAFGLPQQLIVCACCFVAIQSTLISIYPLGLIAVYYVVRKLQNGTSVRAEVRFAVLLAAPHLVLLAVLVQQNALSTLIADAVVFNQRYYSHYDIGGDPVSIVGNSLADFGSLVVRYLRPSGAREIETVLLIGNILAVGVLWRRRGAQFGIFYLALVVFSRMRGPGYHGSPYFLVSFVSMALLVAGAFDASLALLARWSRARAAFAALGALYVAWAALFVHDIGGFYLHLPRGQSLDSVYARAVSAATQPADRLWVAPNGPYVYLQSDRKPASTYSYFQPWLSDSPEISAQVLRDLQTIQPPIVVYEADKHIEWSFQLPTPAEYGGQVYDYLRAAYVPASETDPLLRNVFLRRDQADALRARLVERGLL